MKTWVKMLISLALLSYLFFIIDLEQLASLSLNLNILNILALISLTLFGNLIRTFRWWYLFNDNESKVSVKDATSLFFIGQSLNLVMPAGAGDVVKGYFGFQKSGMKEKMYSISLIDKIIAISSNALLIPFILVIKFDINLLLLGSLCFVPLVIMYFAESFLKIPLFEKVSQFANKKLNSINIFELYKYFRVSIFKISFSLVISAIAWVITYSILLFCFDLVGTPTTYINVFKNIPYLSLGRLFPLTLNGIGSDESIIYFLFKTFISSKEAILMAALLFRIITTIIPGLIGLPFLAFHKNTKK